MSQTDGKLDFNDAKTWIKNWHDQGHQLSGLRGFLIPAEDLQGLLNEMANETQTSKFARAYIALKPVTVGKVTTYEPKLVFVATKQDGTYPDGSPVYRDMITDPVTGREWEGGGDAFDFTTGNPPGEDNQSPFNF